MFKLLIAVVVVCPFLFSLAAEASGKPLRVVKYKNAEVSCFVEIFKETIILRVNNPFGPEGGTINEVVLERKSGALLSNKNGFYEYRKGDNKMHRIEKAHPMKYPHVHRYCLMRRVAGNIPAEVRGIIRDPEAFLSDK